MSLTKGICAEKGDKKSNVKSQTSRTNTDAPNTDTQDTDTQTLELILADADLLLYWTDLCSMILNYLFPSKLKAISRIPLNSFTESEDMLNFIEAVIKTT